MNIAIVGMGLIGGSLAKAFRRYTGHRVIGIDLDPQVLKTALAEEAIHEIGTTESIKNADVIYLCIYPGATVDFLKINADLIRKDCIITDVSGIKSKVYKELKKISEEKGLLYVSSHPMAGKEKQGYSQSEASLFTGASYIIVSEEASLKAVDILQVLAKEVGFASIRLTTAKEHDEMIAFTSQLPHVLACAYVSSPKCMNHKGFSAGSYRDVSRVASINEKLWAELFLENKDAISEEIKVLIDNLSTMKKAIDDNDEKALQELLKKGRLTKEALGE